jgi:hypothetical protein
MGLTVRGRRTRAAFAANVAGTLLGLLILACALGMGTAWQWRHFLPTWAWPWSTQVRMLLVVRLLIAGAGLAVIALLRPWLVRAFAGGRGRQAMLSAAMAALAVVAAFAAAEGILHTRSWRSVQERWDQEPLRVRDREYGWAFLPDHAGSVVLNGHRVHYATGPFGYRAPRAGAGPDFSRPTIVFAGESVIFGYGLDWGDTIPVQVQAMTGVQTANIAVNAHATDQILLRLRHELPRFQRPVAVVIPFMPRLFDRNLDLDRPHLDARLRWHPGERPPLRLVELARRILRYRSSAAIRDGTLMTQRALRAEIALARSRGAQPIVLVPQFLPEDPRERAIRQQVLDAAAIRYLLVPIQPGWRSPGHGHPTTRGSRAIAEALVAWLDRLDGEDRPF